VDKIAQRDGVGDQQLAEGIGRIHDDLGVGNWSVKNMDFAAHEGRLLHGQALSYAVANRGADHMYATFYSVEYPSSSRKRRPWSPPGSGKAERLVQREDLMALNDSGVVCKFSRDFMTPERYELLFDADERLLAAGARTVTLERHFNNGAGSTATTTGSPYEDELPGLDDAIDSYYELRGWNDDGTVPESALPA